MHVETRVLREPGPDRRGFAGAVGVADQMHIEFPGHGLVDGGQELPELCRAVLAVDLADHCAVGDVERGEQAGHAVPAVVAGAPLRACRASSAAPAATGPGPACPI